MRILLFGGTTEGRTLAAGLVGRGHEVVVSVATDVGAEELAHVPGATVLVGRRDERGMATLLAGCDLCVDATHPYATEASANIRAACTRADVPLRRVLRDGVGTQDCEVVSSAPDAARLLAGTKGAVLVTTGAKELQAFAGIDPTRLFARVLPTHAALDACERLGIPHRNIIAMQGPFSQELNEAIMRQCHIRWLVTKDGGREGGMPQKLDAARRCGVRTVLIARPRDEGDETSVSARRLLEQIGEANI